MRLLLGKWGNTKDRLISNLFQRATADGGVLGSSVTCIDSAYSSTYNSSLLTMVPAFGKAGKIYSIIPESSAGDFDVLRNTTGAYVGQDGLIRFAANNEPRFDWTNGCPVLLVDPAATNLLLRSEEFDNAYWIKTRTTITANATSAPNGASTADKLVETAASGTHIVDGGSLTTTSGVSYTLSVFAKAAERSRIVIFGLGMQNAARGFDLSNGTTYAPSGFFNASSFSIAPFAGGWYRCSVRFVDAGAGFGNKGRIILDNGTTNYLGDGTSGVFLWGAQLEVGSVATPYITTAASTVTRNADVITVTPPAGTSEIVTTFEDGTTQVVTSIPGTFTIPNGRVAKVQMT